MIDYPMLKEQPTSREMVDVFKGYNRNLRIKEGEFSDMENLSSDCYPVLAVRKQRGTLVDINNLGAGEKPREGKLTGVVRTDRWGIMYTQGPNMYMRGVWNSPIQLELNDEAKRFVMMGSVLVVLPDMKWVGLNLPTTLYGPCGVWAEKTTGEVKFELCDVNGKAYSGATASATAPESPANLALWIDTSAEPHSLKQYSAATETWVTVTATYVKISGLASGVTSNSWVHDLEKYDGVRISGITTAGATDLNCDTVLWGKDGGSIVVPGIIDETLTQDCGTAGAIRIERRVPVMDYVVEAGNRLWGCRYGKNADGDFVNEIYATELGDFKNWNCFMGISTDSWVGSVGSQGDFTGAAVIGGNPVFYKADMKHTVWISDTGAHRITSTPCEGVKRGCGDSVATIDGVAIYKSPRSFCMDDGSGPVDIGQCFAGAEYSSAVGCACGHKYYVSVLGDDDKRHLFVYDADKKVWHREDDFMAISFAKSGNVMLAIGEDAEKILVMGVDSDWGSEDKMEGAIRWMAQTGEIGIDSPDRKYISRLTLRLSMEVDAELTIYAQYDMEPEWVALGSIRGTSLRSFSLPVRPRRCDHLRLRFEGVGDVKLYSITKTIEEGSEYP